MTPNIFISQHESELKAHFESDFIAHVDGKKASTLRQFYEEIAELLEFPEGFGFHLDAFNDFLNDLQWLEDERIILYFTDTNELVSKERDPNKLGGVLSVLDATAEDWKWTDEEESVDRKEIIIIFEDSPRIKKLLDKECIDYSSLAALKE